jgi:hypothetical protein
MGGGSGSGDVLKAALSSLAAGKVNEVAKLSTLDVFELGSEGLTTGKRFGSNVLVTVTFNSAAEGGDDSENPIEVALELDLPQRWFLEMRTGSAGISSAAAYRRWRF